MVELANEMFYSTPLGFMRLDENDDIKIDN